MNAVFADTFYWIAITNVQDNAHGKAKAFTASTTPGLLFTTEEVLTEYLNYFAAWGPKFRSKAALNVQNMLENPTVQIVPQTSASFSTGLNDEWEAGYLKTGAEPSPTRVNPAQ